MLYRLIGCVFPLICVATSQALGADGPHGANLPLKRVVLFNSGVGFFEHSGQVKDDAKVDMKFKVDDINDLLKSMVVAGPRRRAGLHRHLRLERPDHQDAEELRHRPDGQSHAWPNSCSRSAASGSSSKRPTS